MVWYNNGVFRLIAIGLATAAAIVAAVAITAVLRAQNDFAHANAVIQTSERVLSTLKDVETNFRGYLIVGRQEYLDAYAEALAELSGQTDGLSTASAAEADYATLTARILAAVRRKTEYTTGMVRLQQEQSQAVAAARFASGEGKALMDTVRADIEALQDRAGLKTARSEASVLRPALYVVGGALAVIAAAAGFFMLAASRARRASQRAVQLMADVMARSPVGLAIVDHQGRITQANASFATMAEIPEGAEGKPLAEASPRFFEPIADNFRYALAGFRATWKSQPNVAVTMAGAGRTAHLSATVFPVIIETEEGHDSRGAGIIIADVTRQRAWELELEMAKEEADAANRAKSAFLANMSHELRTPLTAVLGYCELLEEDAAEIGADALLGDLGKIGMNARHLLELINDVLDLSKIEAQRMDVHAIDVETTDMLAEVEAAAGGLLGANGNTFTIDAAAAPATLHTDDLKVKQVLLNLIGNAAKFTHNGTITLKVTEEEGDGRPMAVFSVSDTGIGMTEEQLSGLFERFRQADETTTRKYGGTGLGLALTRGLTAILGGSIEVASTAGVGSTFTARFPVRYEKPAAGPALLDEGEGDAPPAINGTVLVVDDDPASRDVLRRLLQREGFGVASASNGTDALEQARAIQPIAVLLDVMMPGLDGWHVLRALRADPATSDIPVIMQTLVDQEHFAYAHGASGYLKKPVKASKLVEALANVSTSRLVMIIDDDAASRERLARMLTRDGWSVSLQGNGAEALEALAAATPDLIVVDLIMPEMDGHAFIREVRKVEAWNNIPIVVLTAEDTGSGAVRALQPFADDILQKGSMPLAALVAGLKRYAGTHAAAARKGVDDGEAAAG